jgi:uncharacterized protein YaiE (UPF0345 family)
MEIRNVNGKLRFRTINDAHTVFTERLIIDHATGNVEMGGDLDVTGSVGINESSVNTTNSTKLEVKSSSASVTSAIRTTNKDVTVGTAQGASIDFGLSRNSGAYKPQAGKITVGRDADWTSADNNIDAYMSLSTYTNNTLTEKMRITSTGNVGIGLGSATPNRQLVLKDDSLACVQLANTTTGTGSGDGFQLQLSGSTGYLGNYEPSGDIVMFTGASGTERMRITSTGNVLLGGVSDVVASANAPHKLNIPDGLTFGGSAYTYASLHGSGGNVVLSANAYPANIGTESTITFKTATSSGGSANDVVIKAGNVGIGTTSPDATLDVKGTIQVSRTSGYNATWRQFISHESSNHHGTLYVDGSLSTGSIHFRPNGVYRLSVMADGNVGIGTTNPVQKLHVEGRIHSSTSSSSDTVVFDRYNGSGTHTIATITGTNGGLTVVARLDWVGLYGYAGTTHGAGSKIASTRRTVNGTAWGDLDNIDIGSSGNTTGFTLYWENGVLKWTINSSWQITGRISITYHNASSFVVN